MAKLHYFLSEHYNEQKFKRYCLFALHRECPWNQTFVNNILCLCVIEKFAFILSRVRLWKPGHDLGRIAADVIYSTKYNHHNFPIMIFLESCYSSNHDILPIMIFLQSWYFSNLYNSFLRTFRRTFWDFQSSATFITGLGTCSNFAFCAKSSFYESWWLDSNSNQSVFIYLLFFVFWNISEFL